MNDLIFDVVLDETGNYCASAKTVHGSLHTDARNLDALLTMIADILDLYMEDTGEIVERVALRLPVPLNQAA